MDASPLFLRLQIGLPATALCTLKRFSFSRFWEEGEIVTQRANVGRWRELNDFLDAASKGLNCLGSMQVVCKLRRGLNFACTLGDMVGPLGGEKLLDPRFRVSVKTRCAPSSLVTVEKDSLSIRFSQSGIFDVFFCLDWAVSFSENKAGETRMGTTVNGPESIYFHSEANKDAHQTIVWSLALPFVEGSSTVTSNRGSRNIFIATSTGHSDLIPIMTAQGTGLYRRHPRLRFAQHELGSPSPDLSSRLVAIILVKVPQLRDYFDESDSWFNQGST